MNTLTVIFLILATTVCGLGILGAIAIFYIAHDDCGAAAERDSRDDLASIEADFARLKDTYNRF